MACLALTGVLGLLLKDRAGASMTRRKALVFRLFMAVSTLYGRLASCPLGAGQGMQQTTPTRQPV